MGTEVRTGGRPATHGVIPGRYALSVGKPNLPAPQGWRWVQLTDVARLETGHTPSRGHPEYWDGDIPWVGIKDATEHHGAVLHDTYQHVTQLGIENSSARILPANTVCLSRTASVGCVVVMGKPMATSQDFVNWVCSPDLDSRFLKYVLMAERDSFLRFASGTTHQTIYFPEVKAFNICLPPIGEQRRIADVLQALDDKIELNRCMSQTLESMARALFKSWFVDFDPVGARSAGRDPGLPPELAVLFPNSFRDSAIGGVPTGWLVQTLANTLAVLETGARPLGGISGYTAGIPSIGAESIVGLGVFDYSKTKYVPPEFYARMSNGHVHDRDVLLYKDGGRPGMFEPHLTLFGNGFPFAECAINEHVYRIRAAPDLGQSFLFFWLSSDLAMNEMRIKGTGVAIPGLNSTQVKSLTTLVPAPAVARAFNSLVEPLIDRVLATCTESRRLAQLRETALPELLAPQRVVT